MSLEAKATDNDQSVESSFLVDGLKRELETRSLGSDGYSNIFRGMKAKGLKASLPFREIIKLIRSFSPESLSEIFASVQLTEEDRTQLTQYAQSLTHTINTDDNLFKAIAIMKILGNEAKVAESINHTIATNPLAAERCIQLAYSRNPTAQEWDTIATIFIDNVVNGNNAANIRHENLNTPNPDEKGLGILRAAFDLLVKGDSKDAIKWALITKKYLQYFEDALSGKKENEHRHVHAHSGDLDNILFALSKAKITEEEKKDMKQSLAKHQMNSRFSSSNDRREKSFKSGIALLHEIGEFNATKGRDIARKLCSERGEDMIGTAGFNIEKILIALTFSPDSPVEKENIQIIQRLGQKLLYRAQEYFRGAGSNYILSNVFMQAAEKSFNAVLKNDKTNTEGFEDMANLLWDEGIDHHSQPKGPSYTNSVAKYIFQLCKHADIVFPDPALYRWVIDMEMQFTSLTAIDDLATAFRHMALSMANFENNWTNHSKRALIKSIASSDGYVPPEYRSRIPYLTEKPIKQPGALTVNSEIDEIFAVPDNLPN